MNFLHLFLNSVNMWTLRLCENMGVPCGLYVGCPGLREFPGAKLLLRYLGVISSFCSCLSISWRASHLLLALPPSPATLSEGLWLVLWEIRCFLDVLDDKETTILFCGLSLSPFKCMIIFSSNWFYIQPQNLSNSPWSSTASSLQEANTDLAHRMHWATLPW